MLSCVASWLLRVISAFSYRWTFWALLMCTALGEKGATANHKTTAPTSLSDCRCNTAWLVWCVPDSQADHINDYPHMFFLVAYAFHRIFCFFALTWQYKTFSLGAIRLTDTFIGVDQENSGESAIEGENAGRLYSTNCLERLPCRIAFLLLRMYTSLPVLSYPISASAFQPRSRKWNQSRPWRTSTRSALCSPRSRPTRTPSSRGSIVEACGFSFSFSFSKLSFQLGEALPNFSLSL